MSTLNVTKKEILTSIPSTSIKEIDSLENLTSEVAAMSLSKKPADSTVSLDPSRVSILHEVTLLEADAGISFERLIFLQNINLPSCEEAPGYPLVFAAWILGAPSLFHDLLTVRPLDKGSVQVFKDLFNEMVSSLFQEGHLEKIDDFFYKLTYAGSKAKRITEATLMKPFEIKTILKKKREESFNHRIKLEELEEDQPKAIEYLTRLLFQTGYSAQSTPGLLKVVTLPRIFNESTNHKRVWCLDQFLIHHKLISGEESQYIICVRDQHWKPEEDYFILPVIEFSVGQIQYRLKSFSIINTDDDCFSYLIENTILFQIKPRGFFKKDKPIKYSDIKTMLSLNKSIQYFDEIKILNPVDIYIKASREERAQLENPLNEFMVELMGSLDSCIYEKVSSETL